MASGKNQYYIYSYLREDYSPYYIGKGSGKRAYNKGPKEVKPPKDKSRIRILKADLTEDEAFLLEKLYILMFGRIDSGTGILRNRSDGGDGSSGRMVSPEEKRKRSEMMKGVKRPQWIYDKIAASNTGKKLSDETKAKISAIHKGKKCTEEHKRKVSEAKKGFKHTEEAKQKMSAVKKGKKLSPEHIEKIGKAVKLRAQPHKLTFMDGRTLIVNHIGDWAKENGYRGANLYQVKIGDKGRHKDIVKVELVG